MRKKVLALVLALVMVIAMLPTVAFAADFADTKGHWAETQIDRWSDFGVVGGDGTGFNPNGSMTRAQAAQVFVNLLKLTKAGDITAYTDVPATAWYADAISKVAAKGIMNGMSATTMAPDGTLTREQMFVMIGRALGVEPVETATKTFVDGKETSDWATGYINALADMGVINGTGNNELNPTDVINRASVMTVLDNLIGGYANEEGQTVEIVEGKITLIVADDVKVTGTADPDMPIVVAGAAKTVDLEGVTVTGDAAPVVQVQVSDVKVENAPVGAEIKADEGTTGVTANGIDVSADADKDVVIPESTPTTPSTPAPQIPAGPTPSETAQTDINKILTDGVKAVNEKMDYAELSMSGTAVTVKIFDGSKDVLGVKNDILTVLLNALKNNTATVTSITATASTEGAVAPGTEGATLTLSDTLDDTAVIAFVKILVPKIGDAATSGSSTIGALAGKSFTVSITHTNGASYTVTFTSATLEEHIANAVEDVNAKIEKYASAEYADKTLTVTIKNSNTKVTDVHTDIGTILTNALKAHKDEIDSVKGKDTTATDATEATLGAGFDDAALIAFVKELIKVDNKSIAGTDTIGVLAGHSYTITVTYKTTAESETAKTETYTLKFEAGTVAQEIEANKADIAQKVATWATIDYAPETHTLSVVLKSDSELGDAKVTNVYAAIGEPILNALKAHKEQVTDITYGANADSKFESAKFGDAAELKTFVNGLFDDVTISGTTTLSSLKGKTVTFTVNYKDGSPAPETYTISFTQAAAAAE